ncbi:MAG: helix-turn-helix transcriptional regulator [Nanoarchaeota archaeon]
MNKKLIFFLFLILISSNTIFASNYADIKIDITTDGRTNIDGTTNYNNFKNISNSQQYTSKQGKYWIFNLTTNETFSQYIYELYLPINSQINYIKTSNEFNIETQSERIIIKSFGENKKINILVQYKINYNQNNSNFYSTNNIILFVIFVITITILFFIFIKIKSNKKNISQYNNKNNNKIDLELFSQRQQDILKILIKEKKITQKEIEKKLNIPKSSISRNIKTLKIKGIIRKERVGQTNYIILIKK